MPSFGLCLCADHARKPTYRQDFRGELKKNVLIQFDFVLFQHLDTHDVALLVLAKLD